jgi:hypothetical protein
MSQETERAQGFERKTRKRTAGRRSLLRRGVWDSPLSRVLALTLWVASGACSGSSDQPNVEIIRTASPPSGAVTGFAERVILVSIDGLRPDAITAAPATHLLALVRGGTHCPDAQTIDLSETLPSHTSMFTGLDESTHGVVWNDARPGTVSHPTIFSMARKFGLPTAAFFAKTKFHYLIHPGSAAYIYGPPSGASFPNTERRPGGRGIRAEDIAREFSTEWPRSLFRLTFVHLGDTDEAGHNFGWMSPQYLDAVRRADTAVGLIVQAVRDSGQWDSTVLIVTSDHGGHEKIHARSPGGIRIEDTTIPWICAGGKVAAGRTLEGTVRIYDTGPTVLRLLGLPPLEGTRGAVVRGVVP